MKTVNIANTIETSYRLTYRSDFWDGNKCKEQVNNNLHSFKIRECDNGLLSSTLLFLAYDKVFFFSP